MRLDDNIEDHIGGRGKAQCNAAQTALYRLSEILHAVSCSPIALLGPQRSVIRFCETRS
jgi:hypothetical protein